ARGSWALRFYAIQACDPDDDPFRARGAREIVSRNFETPLERSAVPRIHFRRCNASAAGKIAGPIPFSYPYPRQSHHAPEPSRARNGGQIAIPRRCDGHRRRRPLSVVVGWAAHAPRVLAIAPSRSRTFYL